MRNILIVARKEIQEGLRNRWVLATTLLLAALALTLTFLGSAPTGNVGVRALDVVIVSLSSLTIFLVPLIALLISHDAIVGEMERGTMLLLLSYPVGALAGAARQVRGPSGDPRLRDAARATARPRGALAATGQRRSTRESWTAFAAMIGSSILLGAAFIAVGYLVSALVRERGTAAGIAIGIWLLLVLIYDMALLGRAGGRSGRRRLRRAPRRAAAAQPDRRLPSVQPDRIRGNVSAFSGMAGIAQNTSLSRPSFWPRSPLGPCCRSGSPRSPSPGESYEKDRLLIAFAGALALAGCNDQQTAERPAAAGNDGRRPSATIAA